MKRVMLTCGHAREYDDPQIGDLVYCSEHGETTVADVHQHWHFKCKACHFARQFGAAETTARTKAAAHAIKWHHEVTIMKDGRAVGTVGSTRGQHTIALGDTEPAPF